MDFEYTLVRTSRKTVSVSISEDAQLVVRAPKRLSEKEINAFLVLNRVWIEKNLSKAILKKSEKAYATFTHGSYLYLRGKKVEILYVDLVRGAILVDANNIFINLKYSKRAKEIIIAWYKRNAKAYLEKRILEISKENGLVVSRVGISSANTRWGSCSGKNSIKVSWRLLMAPTFVFDYVIYHELAHVTHKNHSQSFWKHVSSFDKDYKKAEKWLKDNGHLLSAV